MPLKQWLWSYEITRPVLDTLALRCWSTLSGIVTVLVIGTYFGPAMQGYYYLFLSLLGLQAFAELNFSITILQFASHEWARLRLDESGRIRGDPRALSCLASLVRLTVPWYTAASLVFFIGAGLGGQWFISQKPQPEFSWNAAWWVLVAISAVQLCLTPLLVILEGCNQVRTLYRFRLLASGVLPSVGLWGAIASGMGLWSPCVSLGMVALAYIAFLGKRYGNFFNSLWAAPRLSAISWRNEILPMQWRLALEGVIGFFGFSLFTPTMFWFHGPAVAGQMGMTWQLVLALQGTGLAWLSPQVPRFGVLIAQKEYGELDRLFFRILKISMGVMAALGSAAWLAVWLLYRLELSLAERLLAPLPTAIFLAGVIVLHVGQCQVSYLRAHKKEVVLALSVLSSLTMGALVLVLGGEFGPVGAGAAYLGVITLFILPYMTWLWAHYRRFWH